MTTQFTHELQRLRDLAEQLEHGSVPSFRFHEHDCASPLPRSYQWADGSAYVNHVELVRKARGAEMPESFWTDPLMYQGGSDSFLGPRDPIPAFDEAHGIDFEAEIAVMRAEKAKALGIRIYTIGAGTRGMAPFPTTNMFGQTVYQNMPVEIDEATMWPEMAHRPVAGFRLSVSASRPPAVPAHKCMTPSTSTKPNATLQRWATNAPPTTPAASKPA